MNEKISSKDFNAIRYTQYKKGKEVKKV